MSLKPRLLAAALLIPACITPAVQGTSATTDATSGATTEVSSEATGEAATDPSASDPVTDTAEPTTSTSGTTSEPATTTGSGPTTDPAPSCDDGQKNQDESDIDCGGGCSGCAGDLACSDGADCMSGRCDAMVCFPLVRSCLELHDARPALTSGSYPLDPDGDGADPLDFVCDMDPMSPGWTQVFTDPLDEAPDGAWSPIVTGACGDLGAILGPYGMGDTLALDISASQVPHTELRLAADAVIMDSWNGFTDERLQIRLDGAEILSKDCDWEGPFTCQQNHDLCNNPEFPDAHVPLVSDPAEHEADSIALEFTSNLNEPITDESWGLAGVSVFVR